MDWLNNNSECQTKLQNRNMMIKLEGKNPHKNTGTHPYSPSLAETSFLSSPLMEPTWYRRYAWVKDNHMQILVASTFTTSLTVTSQLKRGMLLWQWKWNINTFSEKKKTLPKEMARKKNKSYNAGTCPSTLLIISTPTVACFLEIYYPHVRPHTSCRSLINTQCLCSLSLHLYPR